MRERKDKKIGQLAAELSKAEAKIKELESRLTRSGGEDEA
jgi:peptidoglycan hydrolase CwlO-like protein